MPSQEGLAFICSTWALRSSPPMVRPPHRRLKTNLMRDHCESAAQHLASVTLTGLSPSITLAPTYRPLHRASGLPHCSAGCRERPRARLLRQCSPAPRQQPPLRHMTGSTTKVLTCMPV